MISEENVSIPLLLNPDQLLELERLSALQSFSIKRMARYFRVNEKELEARILDLEDAYIEGTIAYHYNRGRDLPIAKGLQQLISSVETGNISAIDQVNKMKKQIDYEEYKQQVLFGS